MVGYDKRFLNLTVGAPGSTHYARFLRNTDLFTQILNGQGLPDKTVDLGDEYGKIHLVTIGDLVFPRFPWLLKNLNCNTKKEESKVFNLKYIIMTCVMLHNFCIAKHDPCNPRWCSSVEEL